MYKKYFIVFCFLALNGYQILDLLKSNKLDAKSLKESKNINFNKNFEKNLENKGNIHNKILLIETLPLFAENIEKTILDENPSGIEIISDTQFQGKEFFIAEGNVVINKSKMILKANKLTYSKIDKKLLIIGDILFKSDNQFITSTKIEYDIKNNKGFIEDVYGNINFNTLNDIVSNKKSNNLIREFNEEDKFIRNVKLNESIIPRVAQIKFKDKKSTSPKLELNEMQNWRFASKKIEIEDNKWKAKKLYLTNDPFNNPQLIINNNNFRSFEEDGDFLIKSKWSTIVLDNFIRIPTGPRRYTVNKKNNYRWDIGYDKKTSDGLFISRNFDSIFLDKNKTRLDFKKYFFLQRALVGKTEAFSKKNEPTLGNKVKQEIQALDLFGLDTELSSEFFGFNFLANAQFNSLDLEKFKKIVTASADLSKVLYEESTNNMQKQTTFSIFSKYRDKIWNGSLGDIEILGSYGSKIEKNNFWIKNNILKSSTIALSYGNYKSGKKEDTSQIIDRKRLNIFLERNHTYPIWRPETKPKFITSEYKYTPSVIPYGLNLFVQTKADFYRYDDDNFQNLYTFRAGPELTLGNFKKKFLDYSKFSILSKTTISDGKSPFKFDQSNDLHAIEFKIEQQILGPLTIKLSTDYNLDINSGKYKELQNNKIEIGWNRRAYKLSFYYREDNQSGGINFKIHNFSFDGLGEPFN